MSGQHKREGDEDTWDDERFDVLRPRRLLTCSSLSGCSSGRSHPGGTYCRFHLSDSRQAAITRCLLGLHLTRSFLFLVSSFFPGGENSFFRILRGENNMRFEEECVFALFDVGQLERVLARKERGSMYGIVKEPPEGESGTRYRTHKERRRARRQRHNEGHRPRRHQHHPHGHHQPSEDSSSSGREATGFEWADRPAAISALPSRLTPIYSPPTAAAKTPTQTLVEQHQHHQAAANEEEGKSSKEAGGTGGDAKEYPRGHHYYKQKYAHRHDPTSADLNARAVDGPAGTVPPSSGDFEKTNVNLNLNLNLDLKRGRAVSGAITTKLKRKEDGAPTMRVKDERQLDQEELRSLTKKEQ